MRPLPILGDGPAPSGAAPRRSAETATTPGLAFRDPPPVAERTAPLRVAIARALVGAERLPIELPRFGLRLLDVEARRGERVSLVLGMDAPIASLDVAPAPGGSERPVRVEVRVLGPGAETRRERLADMAARVERAVDAARWSTAAPLARELAALPHDVPLGFYRQLVAGTRDATALVRTGFQCNQDCGLCWQGRDWGRHGPEQVLAWIEDLAASGVPRLIISGGEPTLDPELPRYVARAREVGFSSVVLETNAIQLAKPGQAAKLRAVGLTDAFVSLHSGEAAISDAITRAPGTHARTVRGIAALLEAGVHVVLNAVMTEEGLGTLAGLPDFIVTTFGLHPGLGSLMLSYPTEPFDPSLSAAIAPDPARLRAALRSTIDRACSLGLVVRGLDGPCGPQLCAFDADPRVTELAPIAEPVDFRRHLPACDGCAVRASCLGVRHAEIERFGDAAVTPLARSPLPA